MSADDRRAARLLATVLVVLALALTAVALVAPMPGSLAFPLSAAAGIVALVALAPGSPRRD